MPKPDPQSQQRRRPTPQSIHPPEAKARLPALQPDLQAAVAGAGQAVLATALPEMGEQAQALYWAQAGDAAGQQAGAVALGAAAGREVLAMRATDGANATGPDYMGSNDTGMWRPTPPMFKPGGGVAWRKVAPYVMGAPEELRPAAPPGLKSAEYKKSYLEGACVACMLQAAVVNSDGSQGFSQTCLTHHSNLFTPSIQS